MQSRTSNPFGTDRFRSICLFANQLNACDFSRRQFAGSSINWLMRSIHPVRSTIPYKFCTQRPRILFAVVVKHEASTRERWVPDRFATVEQVGTPDENIAFLCGKANGTEATLIDFRPHVSPPAFHLCLEEVILTIGKHIRLDMLATRIVSKRAGMEAAIFQRNPNSDQMPF